MSLDTLLPILMLLLPAVGGVLGYRWGGVTGGSIGVAIGFSPFVLFAAAYGAVTVWFPDRPVCICGQCKSEDYKYLGFRKPARDTHYYKCSRCQRHYRLENGRFDLRQDDESYKPYMKLSKWGRWKPNAG